MYFADPLVVLVQALGAVVDHLWCGSWPEPLRRLGAELLARRPTRWEAVNRQVREAWRREAVMRTARGNDPAASSVPQAARLSAERDRIRLVCEERLPVALGRRITAMLRKDV
ncbi:hypothetical protein ACFY3N_19830 [Streptomyces sp. NPDC000348]|uniref:hypothetical protein n=1 Tax=Streptomyces sp. NPDC000348 TaxID=3364538 RepID=UPI00367F748E